ncbi:ATP-binding protein [Amycolatopsis sp. NEAU-NG30]|uniref:ATP-binding protein n=1 Tax=Amycolatopsis melonis TaxID=3156488 RepID=A0ABV0LAQ2_9PSEU
MSGDDAAWSVDLRGTDPSALSGVRRWTARTVPRLGPDHLSDLLIVIDELVANAYLHRGGPVEARLTVPTTPCRVVVEVEDHSPIHPVQGIPRPDLPEMPGQGMSVIRKLADSWGVHENPDFGGKTV